jgi:hypothetical protein
MGFSPCFQFHGAIQFIDRGHAGGEFAAFDAVEGFDADAGAAGEFGLGEAGGAAFEDEFAGEGSAGEGDGVEVAVGEGFGKRGQAGVFARGAAAEEAVVFGLGKDDETLAFEFNCSGNHVLFLVTAVTMANSVDHENPPS